MADLKALSDEMTKLQKQIETVLSISDYRNYEDLSGLADYKEIRSADALQRLEEYRNILYRLDEVQAGLAYLEKPIKEVSRIYRNKIGRYEANSGYYYTSGSCIEFLRTTEVYNYDTDTYEDVEVWTTSRVESKDGEYYIVGYPDISLSGLKVRIRR